jgi:hypothetical protein
VSTSINNKKSLKTNESLASLQKKQFFVGDAKKNGKSLLIVSLNIALVEILWCSVKNSIAVQMKEEIGD